MLAGGLPADGYRFQTVSFRNLPVLSDTDLPKLWKLQSSLCKHDIPIYHICGIAVLILMSRFESRKSRLRIPKEIPVRPFQMELDICKSQGIHFLQERILFLVHCRSILQHLAGNPVLSDLF